MKTWVVLKCLTAIVVAWSAAGCSDSVREVGTGTPQPDAGADSADAAAANEAGDAVTAPDTAPDSALETGADALAEAADAPAEASPIPDAELTPYGYIETVEFATLYLFDYDKAVDPDAGTAYINSHPEGLQTSTPAFVGTYGVGNTFPPLGTSPVAYGLHIAEDLDNSVPPQIAVAQQFTLQDNYVGPALTLNLISDNLAVGPLHVGVYSSDKNWLMLLEYIPGGSCLRALAIGELEVTVAQATTAEGGKLSLVGSHVPLYYPTETPFGDVSKNIEWQEMPLCPK